MNARLLPALALSTATLLMPVGRALAADAAAPENDAIRKLEDRVQQMQQALDATRQELQALKAQNDALAAAQQQQAMQQQSAAASSASARNNAGSAAGNASGAAEASPSEGRTIGGGISDNLSLWGYGEVYYTHPTHDSSLTQFDLARAVFGIGYRFDDRTVFNSEYEVEHAVSSADDAGEFEVEQFYVDHQLASWASVKAGLFLMPFGLLNEHHEPTNFYGVQRNFVETLIIPSTWREGGVGFHGTTNSGLTWDVGVTSGFNLGGFEINPEDPQYRTALDLINNGVGPLSASHQELQLANAQHLSEYVSLNYSGIPGLLAGAAVFTGTAARPSFPPDLPDQRVTLWEAHARWTPGPAEFSAVYARGTISNTETFNLDNAGASNPVPSEFLGYYVQGAYNLWQNGGYRLSPFVRWEHYDMGASYDGIAPGFTTVPEGLASDGKPWPVPRDQVWTFGASFFLNPHVVLKADYQTFHNNSDLTRFDLGLGLSF